MKTPAISPFGRGFYLDDPSVMQHLSSGKSESVSTIYVINLLILFVNYDGRILTAYVIQLKIAKCRIIQEPVI